MVLQLVKKFRIMKNISKFILGMIFVFGMTSMSDTNVVTEKLDTVNEYKVPCYYVFDVCDTVYPEDYGLFAACMRANGC